MHSWRGKLILLRSRWHFISLACSSPIVLELILKAVNLHLTSFSIFAKTALFPSTFLPFTFSPPSFSSASTYIHTYIYIFFFFCHFLLWFFSWFACHFNLVSECVNFFSLCLFTLHHADPRDTGQNKGIQPNTNNGSHLGCFSWLTAFYYSFQFACVSGPKVLRRYE